MIVVGLAVSATCYVLFMEIIFLLHNLVLEWCVYVFTFDGPPVSDGDPGIKN